MNFEDEKDYIMRVIKEMVRMLFALLFGQKQFSVEQELQNGCQVSGKKLDELLAMTDNGGINEAENIILAGIDYSNKSELAAAALFYQYLSGKDNEFLRENNYSRGEILDGIKNLMQKSGYGDVAEVVESTAPENREI